MIRFPERWSLAISVIVGKCKNGPCDCKSTYLFHPSVPSKNPINESTPEKPQNQKFSFKLSDGCFFSRTFTFFCAPLSRVFEGCASGRGHYPHFQLKILGPLHRSTSSSVLSCLSWVLFSAMAEAGKLRLVLCPKCENLLPELENYSVYECGGCGAVLRGLPLFPSHSVSLPFVFAQYFHFSAWSTGRSLC